VDATRHRHLRERRVGRAAYSPRDEGGRARARPSFLSTQNKTLRTKWAAHNVRFHDTGVKFLHHPVVGEVERSYEANELSAESGLTMFAYAAEPAQGTRRS
jgi:hypothetical protein